VSLIKIDGVSYDIGAIQLKRNSDIIYDNLTKGRTLDFSEIEDAVAVRYSYSFTIEPKSGIDSSVYDAFYYDITTPKSVRLVELPFAQSDIAFKAKIKAVSDVLYKRHNGSKWGSLNVTFEPVKPQRYNN
jgi:hypothetical protein